MAEQKPKKLVIKLTDQQAEGVKGALGVEDPCTWLEITLPDDPGEVVGMSSKAGGGPVAVYMAPLPGTEESWNKQGPVFLH